jgi:hypothetical protein
MKKTFTMFSVLLFVVLFTGVGISQQLFSDDFNYSTGNLAGQGGWTGFSSTATPIQVTTPGLTYTNYVGSGNYNAVTLGTSGQDASHKLSSSVNSGSVMVSAMVKVTATQTNGDYFMHFGTGTSTFTGKLHAKTNGTGFSFGISKVVNSTNALTVWSATSYPLNVTHLVVFEYVFVGGTLNDVVNLYVDPTLPLDPCTMPAPTLTANDGLTGTDAVIIDSVYIRQGNAAAMPSVVIDGIRVGLACLDLPLPVELSSFTSTVNGRNVLLNWTTKTEKNSDKFIVEKLANSAWVAVGSVKASGLSNSTKQYSFTDRDLQVGKYQYRLKLVDNDGTFSYSSEVATEVAAPRVFELNQNYPNPFNPSTKISYSIAADSKVTLEVYNMTGQLVGQLVNNIQPAGYYTVDFNTSSISKNISSGIYLYRISAVDNATGKNFISVKKMMLIK